MLGTAKFFRPWTAIPLTLLLALGACAPSPQNDVTNLEPDLSGSTPLVDFPKLPVEDLTVNDPISAVPGSTYTPLYEIPFPDKTEQSLYLSVDSLRADGSALALQMTRTQPSETGTADKTGTGNADTGEINTAEMDLGVVTESGFTPLAPNRPGIPFTYWPTGNSILDADTVWIEASSPESFQNNWTVYRWHDGNTSTLATSQIFTRGQQLRYLEGPPQITVAGEDVYWNTAFPLVTDPDPQNISDYRAVLVSTKLDSEIPVRTVAQNVVQHTADEAGQLYYAKRLADSFALIRIAPDASATLVANIPAAANQYLTYLNASSQRIAWVLETKADSSGLMSEEIPSSMPNAAYDISDPRIITVLDFNTDSVTTITTGSHPIASMNLAGSRLAWTTIPQMNTETPRIPEAFLVDLHTAQIWKIPLDTEGASEARISVQDNLVAWSYTSYKISEGAPELPVWKATVARWDGD